MGLLDDAIREHLELKRQRGADPSEVAKQEKEAFGPIQRGTPARAAGSAPAADQDLGPGPALEEREPELPPIDRPHGDPHIPPVEDPPPPAEDEPPIESPPEAPHGDPLVDREWMPSPDPDPAPAPRAGGAAATNLPADPAGADRPAAFGADDPVADLEWNEPPPRATPSADALERAGQPTAEYDVRDLERLRAGAASDDDEPDVVPADEDVLEETPDFLAEAPEHDRLWFEQRPPRDFDF